MDDRISNYSEWRLVLTSPKEDHGAPMWALSFIRVHQGVPHGYIESYGVTTTSRLPATQREMWEALYRLAETRLDAM